MGAGGVEHARRGAQLAKPRAAEVERLVRGRRLHHDLECPFGRGASGSAGSSNWKHASQVRSARLRCGLAACFVAVLHAAEHVVRDDEEPWGHRHHGRVPEPVPAREVGAAL